MSTQARHASSLSIHALLRGTALCCLATASPAIAQQAPSSNSTISPALAQQVPSSDTTADIVVTGSHIPQTQSQSIAPVSVVGAVDIATTGVTRIEDLLNKLPQVTADQNSGTTGSYGTGTATINLRNLGPQRTLVLIDGQRLPSGGYYPGINSTGSAADINLVPTIMIDRVEILTGGASAVYGADAVAGVVNFVLKDHFQGLRVTGTLSGYQHDQQETSIQNVVKTAGEPLPDSNVFDGKSVDINLVAGSDFDDKRGNITAYAGYRNTGLISAADRDFSACTLSPANATAPYVCGGSSTNYPGRFKVNGKSYSVDANGDFVPYTGSFNYGKYNALQRPDKRIIAGFKFHYELSDHATLYSQFNFMNDRTDQYTAPAGYIYGSGPASGGGYYVNCNNPFLSSGQATTICGANAGTSAVEDVSIGRRNVEGGVQTFFQRHNEFRGVIGIKGSFGSNDIWHYDVSVSEAHNSVLQIYNNVWLTTNMNAAIQAVVDPATGNIVCNGNQNGGNLHPGCVPYDPWRTGAVTQAMTNYLTTPFEFRSSTGEQIISGNLTGDLARYGLKSPWTNDGASLALGADFRRSTLEFDPDSNLQQGLTSFRPGFDMTPIPFTAIKVWELYPELRIPIASNLPAFNSLAAELGYRYSNYSVGFATSTWKAGLSWAPVKAIRFRGEINRAVRAPNIAELYGAQYIGVDGVSDACAGSSPTATAAQCANTGVTGAEYGHIEANAAAQYNGLQGGNRSLTPEKATTKTLGVVFAPSGVLRSLVATVDYYDTKINNIIGTLGADYILSTCIKSDQLCSLVHRDPNTGSLWEGNQGYVIDTLLNKGSLAERGIDFSLNDRVPLGKPGALDISFSGSYLFDLKTTNANGTSYDSAGLYGLVAGQPNPKWRHRARVMWETPLSGLDFSTTWRFIDSVGLDAASSQSALQNSTNAAVVSDRKLPTMNYFDLAVSYQIRNNKAIRIGVNNLLDKDPPIVSLTNLSTTLGTANTFPGVYDTTGRYIFVQFDLGF